MVNTLEKQLSHPSDATLSSKALLFLRFGAAVLDDSKLGMLATDGKGELLMAPPPTPPRGSKLLANSALEGRAGPAPTYPDPTLPQAGTSQGQSHRRLASSKARPNGHLRRK